MEWEVVSSKGVCKGCGRSFGNREEYWSVLRESPDGFQRGDYCADCWTALGEGVFSHWRTRCKLEPEPPKRFVDDGVLLDFFERLCESEDPSRVKIRFIMAVLLLRKRLLRERGRRRDEKGVVWTLEASRLKKTFEVRDEGLIEEEVAELLHEIGRVLNVQLETGDAGGEEESQCPDSAESGDIE